jgi:hypothetical protein
VVLLISVQLRIQFRSSIHADERELLVQPPVITAYGTLSHPVYITEYSYGMLQYAVPFEYLLYTYSIYTYGMDMVGI